MEIEGKVKSDYRNKRSRIELEEKPTQKAKTYAEIAVLQAIQKNQEVAVASTVNQSNITNITNSTVQNKNIQQLK